MKSQCNNLFIILAILVLFCSCSETIQEELAEPKQPSNEVQIDNKFPVIKGETSSYLTFDRNEIDANVSFNRFGLRFFNEVSKDNNDNFVVSPVSNCFALAMMANVFDENYEKSVCAAMGCDNISSLNTLCNKLMMYLPNEHAFCDVSIANSVWHAPCLYPTDDYVEQMNGKFYADVVPLDFNKPQAADTINLWVDAKTNGLISHFVDYDKISGADFMTLNALYFNGGWLNRFDKNNTEKATFFGLKEKSDIDFMNISQKLTYCKNESGEWIYLPYSGLSYKLILALPNQNSNINQLLQSFDVKYLSDKELISLSDVITVTSCEVNLSLPKFNIETEIYSDGYFENLGIKPISKGLHNLIGNGSNSEKIVRTLHKTVVNIDEEGSSAASATGNIVVGASGDNESVELSKIDLTFNRPFIYFICNAKTGSIMVAGKVTQL